VKQVYESSSPRDGYRVLVDKFWPRGVRRDVARIDEWLKDAAPSDELRHWFEYDPIRWSEFRERYDKELHGKEEVIRGLRIRSRGKDIALLFASSDKQHNNAVVLKEFIETLK